MANYEKSIQTAFQEVADGLAARQTYTEQLQAQRDFVTANQDYYRLAERRYRIGVDSNLTFLDAQRQLFSAQQVLITDRLAQLISAVNLYKALGGGWNAQTGRSRTAERRSAEDEDVLIAISETTKPTYWWAFCCLRQSVLFWYGPIASRLTPTVDPILSEETRTCGSEPARDEASPYTQKPRTNLAFDNRPKPTFTN